MLLDKVALIWLSFQLSVALIKKENEDSIKLAQQVTEVVRKFYLSKGSHVNLVSSEALSDVTNMIARQINLFEKVSITIEHSSEIHVGFPKRKLNVFVVDSVQAFKKIDAGITTKFFDFHGYFTIVYINKEQNQTRKVFDLMWQKQIYNVVVLSMINGTLKAQNFNPFSNQSCNDLKPKRVEEVSDYFDQTLKDMKLCSLKVHAPDWPPFIFFDDSGNAAGRDFEFIKILEEKLNFKINLTILREPAAWGMLFANGTATGAIKKLIDSETDMIVGDFYLRESRIKFMDPSAEYFNAEVVFVVPPGRNVEPIEKLLQPFSRPVWICFNIAILSFLIFILGLNFWTNGIYKARLINLFFKVLSIVVGVSTSHPRRFFHRILFITLTAVSLVLIAAYEGSLYRFLQKDSKMKEVQSIDEMVENNFQFYSYDSMLEIIEQSSIIKNR